jgi:hypothetical protein
MHVSGVHTTQLFFLFQRDLDATYTCVNMVIEAFAHDSQCFQTCCMF